jgi:hypothetical protein
MKHTLWIAAAALALPAVALAGPQGGDGHGQQMPATHQESDHGARGGADGGPGMKGKGHNRGTMMRKCQAEGMSKEACMARHKEKMQEHKEKMRERMKDKHGKTDMQQMQNMRNGKRGAAEDKAMDRAPMQMKRERGTNKRMRDQSDGHRH